LLSPIGIQMIQERCLHQ